MNTVTLLFLASLCKICSAGWPCCLKGNRDDDTHPLNISNPNKDDINTSESVKNGVNCKIFFPKEGVNVTSVVYKSQVLWTVTSGKKCVFVQSYTGRYTLLTIGIYENDVYEPSCFRKRCGRWRKMDLGSFNNKLDKMMRASGSSSNLYTGITIPFAKRGSIASSELAEAIPQVYATPTERLLVPTTNPDGQVLDLANPDKNIMEVRESGNEASNYKGYLPVNGAIITSVVYSGMKIWEAKPGEKCEFAGLNFTKDHFLLALDVSVGKRLGIRYFEKKDESWDDNVTQDDFLRKLCEMRRSKPKLLIKPPGSANESS